MGCSCSWPDLTCPGSRQKSGLWDPEIYGPERSGAPLLPRKAPEAGAVLGPTRAMMMRSSWFRQVPSPQQMGSKIHRLTNLSVVRQPVG